MSHSRHSGHHLADAAVSAAVPHVVFSSVGGAERDSRVPHFESKRRVEEYLEKSGLRATVVRPEAFMDNFADMGPSVENGEIVLSWPLPDHIRLQLVSGDADFRARLSRRQSRGPARQRVLPAESCRFARAGARGPGIRLGTATAGPVGKCAGARGALRK
jgi:uncharacterized protein YbjT (DUF2867 family)